LPSRIGKEKRGGTEQSKNEVVQKERTHMKRKGNWGGGKNPRGTGPREKGIREENSAKEKLPQKEKGCVGPTEERKYQK